MVIFFGMIDRSSTHRMQVPFSRKSSQMVVKNILSMSINWISQTKSSVSISPLNLSLFPNKNSFFLQQIVRSVQSTREVCPFVFRWMVLWSRILLSFDYSCEFVLYLHWESPSHWFSMSLSPRQEFLSLFIVRSIDLFIHTFPSIIRSQSNLSIRKKSTSNMDISSRNIYHHSYSDQQYEKHSFPIYCLLSNQSIEKRHDSNDWSEWQSSRKINRFHHHLDHFINNDKQSNGVIEEKNLSKKILNESF